MSNQQTFKSFNQAFTKKNISIYPTSSYVFNNEQSLLTANIAINNNKNYPYDISKLKKKNGCICHDGWIIQFGVVWEEKPVSFNLYLCRNPDNKNLCTLVCNDNRTGNHTSYKNEMKADFNNQADNIVDAVDAVVEACFLFLETQDNTSDDEDEEKQQ